LLKRHNPGAVAPPLARYSHAIEVPAGARWLHLSGQVGVRPDGTLAEGPQAQIEQTWANILALLQAAGMSVHDLVKVTVFLTDPAHIQLQREVRQRVLTGVTPASTLLIVAGLAQPDLLVEIEAVAAAV
jgi:2-iminobutanoate/2-iminopropanoate deaminase